MSGFTSDEVMELLKRAAGIVAQENEDRKRAIAATHDALITTLCAGHICYEIMLATANMRSWFSRRATYLDKG